MLYHIILYFIILYNNIAYYFTLYFIIVYYMLSLCHGRIKSEASSQLKETRSRAEALGLSQSKRSPEPTGAHCCSKPAGAKFGQA